MDVDLVPIGQFARLSRLSVKQLRHYAELGLLVPLPVIAAVLAGAETALDDVRATQEAELARRRRTLAALERIMADGLPSVPVRVVTEPTRPVVARESAAGLVDVPRATSAAIARLPRDVPRTGPSRLKVPRGQWRWHILLSLPSMPQDGAVERAREQVRASCRAVDRVRLATITEGRCVELPHEGPYSEEHLSLKVMEEFMAEHGLVPDGPHHEIYLTAFDDPAPRTVLRQPVRAA